jgi:hypothetical protein
MGKIEAKGTLLIPEMRRSKRKKNEQDQSKTNRGGIFKTFMEPKNRFQGNDSASLCPVYSSLFIQELKKIDAKRTGLIPERGKIEAKKNEQDQSKTDRGGIFKTFMEPKNRFQGNDSASLCPGGLEPIFVDV